MKRKFLLIAVLMLAIFVVTSHNIVFADEELANGTCGTGLDWTLSSSGVLTISGTGTMSDYSDEPGQQAPWYDYRNSIVEVVICDGVTNIGKDAFYLCSALGSITIPQSVGSIGNEAFRGCKAMADCIILDSVTNLGTYLFYGCSNLRNVQIPDTVTDITGMFYGCSSLENFTIPKNVSEIGFAAFRNCTSLTSITMSDSTKTILGMAFENCNNLKDVYVYGNGGWSIYSGNESFLNAETHNYKKALFGQWTPIIEATCLTEGNQIKYTEGCSGFEESVIPAIGHQWDSVYSEDVPATCSEYGSESIHCKNCGIIQEGSQQRIEKLPHTMLWDPSHDVLSTCTESGIKAYKCSSCGEIEQETVLPLGHDWNPWGIIAYPGVMQYGVESRTCSRCGISEQRGIPKLAPYGFFGESTYKIAKKETLYMDDELTRHFDDYVISWKVSKKKIAKISKNGKLKAKKKGTVTVTATLASGINVSCKIKISKKKKSSGGKVYWVPGGSVYHKSRDCPTLDRSSNIKSGSIKKSKKKRCCKVCG